MEDAAEKGELSRADGGITVTFQDVTYTVRKRSVRRAKLDILRRVSGFFNPAQMTAVMGPSGSGKTTLLDLLAGRKNQGELHGEIRFGGQQATRSFLRRHTGYVEQFDTLVDELTVNEMLMYTAELKRSRHEPLAAKQALVDGVVSRLALESCRDTRIGSVLSRGISGGEAKRTNVGIALVGEPRVLFLDEPTSGLDSYTASGVMQVVQGLTSTGMTLCATIHSPTARTFALFDRVLILQRGRVVYHGANGSALSEYFGREQLQARPLGTGEALAEYIVDVTTEADRHGDAERFADAYDVAQREHAVGQPLVVEQHGAVKDGRSHIAELGVRRSTTVPGWWALWVLVKYRSSRNFRSGAYLGARLGDKCLFGFVLATLWWQLGGDYSSANAFNIAGILNFWVTMPAFGAAAYIPGLVLDRPVFLRETADGLFRPVVYLGHKVGEEVALAFVASLLFALLLYFAVGLTGDWVVLWLAYLVTLCIGIALAYLTAALSPTLAVANAALPSYVVTLLFFTGLLPAWDAIPKWWKWYGYLNPLRYGYGAVAINGFEGHLGAMLGGLPALQFLGLEGQSKWAFLCYESLFFCFFFACAWAAVHFIRWDRR